MNQDKNKQEERQPNSKEIGLEDTFEDKREKEIGPSDSNYPLLKSYREAAPGSFKHTQALVDMVENVISSVDMDLDELRLAALYHDIGKMLAPQLFTENQGIENMHDDLPPWVSYSLITRHVSDSVMILVTEGFPRKVIEIVSQHHGQGVLRAIFEKAKDANPQVNEDDFRYHTPKPSSVDALILMLCDQVEATSRSLMIDQNKKDVDPSYLVTNIFNRLSFDGQFDNVQIVLGMLKKIQSALIKDIASTFQKRVAYKEDEELILEPKKQ
jgi:hypothetical protein